MAFYQCGKAPGRPQALIVGVIVEDDGLVNGPFDGRVVTEAF